MSITELKEMIQQKIMHTNDEQLLSAINTILSKSENVFIVPEEHKKIIADSIKDLDEGNYHTLSDFEEKYSKWLKD